MKTTAQVKMWGNSLAIRIPSRIARDLGLSDNSQIEITSDGTTASFKRETSTNPSLDALVSNITPDNVHTEVDWGTPVGNEAW